MIKIFVSLGVVGGLIVAYLTVLAVGPISQLPPPESLLTNFRAEGIVPAEVNLPLDESAEEAKVFHVPETDAVHLKAARAAYEKMTSGMDMGGMNMSSGDSSTMNMASGDSAAMPSGGDSSTMNMASGDSAAMPSGSDSSTMNMASGDSAAMPSGGDSATMPAGNANMTMASGQMPMAEDGLAFSEDGKFDREITLTMEEWKFDKMKIDVKMGERIKFTVKNGGQIPHEFMFMSPPLMQAVTYRAARADWNLLEHEALYERALVLPGGEFTFVMQVQKPGAWMFMCMLPYHMQMGMMGQMSTKGMAMDM